MSRKRIYPKTFENALGHWAYVDVEQFYIETKEYAEPAKAIAALKRILNTSRYEIIGDELKSVDQNDTPIDSETIKRVAEPSELPNVEMPPEEKELCHEHMETTQINGQDTIQSGQAKG